MKNKLAYLFLAFSMLVGLGLGAEPTIQGTTLDPLYPADGETVTLDIEATDDTGITSIGFVSVDPNSNVVDSDSGSFSSPYPTSYNTAVDGGSFSTTPQQIGDYTLEFYVTDDEGNNISVFRTMQVTDTGGEPTPDWTLTNPQDGEIFTYPSGDTGANIDFTGSIDAPSSGTVELAIDFQDGNGFQTYYSESVSAGGDTFSTTELIGDTGGDYPEFAWEFTSDETGSTYDSPIRIFTVEQDDAPPTITQLQATPSSPSVGESVDVDVEATDDNGITDLEGIVRDPGGTTISTFGGATSGDPTSIDESFNDLFTPSETGTYEVEFTVTDTDSQQTTQTLDVSVSSEQTPSFSLNNPSNGQTYSYAPDQSSTTVTYDGSVSTSFSGTLKIFRGNTQIYSQSISSGSSSYSTDESLSQGNYSYYVEVTSSASSNSYTSSTRDFTVEEADEIPPAISTSYPGQGDTIFYSEADSFARVIFDGQVDAPYSGSGNITVWGDGINGSVKESFNHSPESTGVEFNSTLTNGTFTWNIIFQSDQTGDKYAGINKTFTVAQTNEPIPEQAILLPPDGLNSSALGNPIDYSAYANTTFNGTTTISVEYPGFQNGSSYVQQIDQISLSPGNNTLSGSFSLVTSEKEPGTYRFRIRTVSDTTGNSYSETKRTVIEPAPFFEYVRPNNATIILDDFQTYQNTRFQARLGYVTEGIIRFQIRDPDGGDWENLRTLEAQNYQDSVELDFESVIQGIEFVGQDDNGREFSGNYSIRTTFSPEGSSSIYSSSFSEYNYKEPTLGYIQSFERFINGLFGEYGTLLVTVLVSILVMAYLGVLSEGSVLPLGGGLAVVVGATVVGFVPGFVGLVMSIGFFLLLILAVDSNG